MTNKQQLHTLFQLIDRNKLTASQVEILNLYLDQKLSRTNMGHVLNLSLPEVKKRLVNATLALKKLGNDPGYDKAMRILYGKQV